MGLHYGEWPHFLGPRFPRGNSMPRKLRDSSPTETKEHDARGGIWRRICETFPHTEPVASWSAADGAADWWRGVLGYSYIFPAPYFAARSDVERRRCDAVHDDMRTEWTLIFLMCRAHWKAVVLAPQFNL